MTVPTAAQQRVQTRYRFAYARQLSPQRLWGVFSETSGFGLGTGATEEAAWRASSEAIDERDAELARETKTARVTKPKGEELRRAEW